MEGQIVAFRSLWGAQWATKGLKLGHEAINKAESFLKREICFGSIPRVFHAMAEDLSVGRAQSSGSHAG